MIDRNSIVRSVSGAIEALNQTLPPQRRVACEEDSRLLGDVDSMGLVNLIVATEERLFDDHGVELNLADQRAVASRMNPLSTVGTFVDFIHEQINDRSTHS